MARLSRIRGTTAYLDTNLFIYAVEGYEPEEAFVRALFLALEGGEFAAVTSDTVSGRLVRLRVPGQGRSG